MEDKNMAEEQKEAKFQEEIQNMEYEPLEPAEMKMIHWSWGLGVGLLVILYIISRYMISH